MKLTDTNITELYKFTRQHYVEHYDVQTELVDHLANDIEAIWKEDPNLSFEKARGKSFKKFGVFGFMNVVEEKHKQVGRKYRKILWKMLKEWFTFPKAIFTFSLILLFYTLYNIPVFGEYIYYGTLLISGVYFFLKFRKILKTHKKRIQQTGRNWLLEDMIFKIAGSNSLVFFANFYNIFSFQKLIQKPSIILLLSIITVLIILTCYIALELIPNKAEELLEEQYPEYKLV